MRAVLVALFLCLTSNVAGAQSIGGVDCATIRKLTALERWYWIKRLGLTPAQLRTIRHTCRIK